MQKFHEIQLFIAIGADDIWTIFNIDCITEDAQKLWDRFLNQSTKPSIELANKQPGVYKATYTASKGFRNLKLYSRAPTFDEEEKWTGEI